nr:MAG TPA: hypothetical protein [Caudoviricetes sp.]
MHYCQPTTRNSRGTSLPASCFQTDNQRALSMAAVVGYSCCQEPSSKILRLG